MLDGETVIHENGTPQMRLSYRTGVLEGESLFLDESGRVWRKATYVKAVLHGPSIDYYPNGRVREAAEYRHNKLHGETVRYDEIGTRQRAAVFRHGPTGAVSESPSAEARYALVTSARHDYDKCNHETAKTRSR